MEVSSAPYQFASFDQSNTSTSTDIGAMDVDMKDDMDIDIIGDAELLGMDNDATLQDFGSEPQGLEAGQVIDDPFATETDAAPEKVYIWGLDDLTTEDIERYASEYFPTDSFVKVQWINDHSANLVYTDSETAAHALAAFTDETQVDLLSVQAKEERRAKPVSWRDTAPEFKVRQATLGDVKVKRAHEQSRFYLMNPDKDPREQTRDYDSGRNERGDYRRRKFDDREHRRRREGRDRFDVNMYDDDAGERPRSSRSASDDSYRKRRRVGRDNDLFGDRAAGRRSGRLRDRSASPIKDGDGRMGFAEDQPRRRTARQRSATPEHLRRPVERDYNQSNAGKELFPVSRSSSALAESNGPVKELFPVKASPVRLPKELFPHKTSISNHRRTPAFDASPRSLADRITGGPRSSLQDRPRSRNGQEEQGFGIRGAAQPGFSIRGAATDASTVVKELFPLKAGSNAGKELFGEKIKGRGGARRRAEDMF